jgi:hypothetical protein
MQSIGVSSVGREVFATLSQLASGTRLAAGDVVDAEWGVLNVSCRSPTVLIADVSPKLLTLLLFRIPGADIPVSTVANR